MNTHTHNTLTPTPRRHRLTDVGTWHKTSAQQRRSPLPTTPSLSLLRSQPVAMALVCHHHIVPWLRAGQSKHRFLCVASSRPVVQLSSGFHALVGFHLLRFTVENTTCLLVLLPVFPSYSRLRITHVTPHLSHCQGLSLLSQDLLVPVARLSLTSVER